MTQRECLSSAFLVAKLKASEVVMKSSVLFFFTLFSLNAFAGVVNLSVGDSITILANTQTVVTCGVDGNKCVTPIKNFKSQIDFCKGSQNNSVEECLQEYWPKFKRNYTTCVDEAFQTCLNFCKSDPFGLDCLDLCSF